MNLGSRIILVFGLIVSVGCRSDIRTKMVKQNGVTEDGTAKGKEILDRAWKAHGFENLKNHTVYSFNGHDLWKGPLSPISKLWPDKDMRLHFKYEIGTFDGQVKYLSGKHKDEVKGLQNWNYYEIDSDTTFMKPNSKVQFGIAAFQYFTEMIDRLRQAPIIVYAGEDEMRGQKYDLVFCTWNSTKPDKDLDQYMAWVNKETGLLEFTQYTIRENFLHMPGAKLFYAGVEYSNIKSIDDILIPHTQTVYNFNLKENSKRFLHKMEISDFKFDTFPLSDLKISKDIDKSGDFK